jgi:hypothetical protein
VLDIQRERVVRAARGRVEESAADISRDCSEHDVTFSLFEIEGLATTLLAELLADQGYTLGDLLADRRRGDGR